jgi:cobalt-precorrin-5B (C1)-methyltransferase
MAREAMTALRRGWTTGACAAAAARAAFTAMLTCRFPDPVSIRLPRGGTASFPLAMAKRGKARACVGVIKDAGDDPDITNGALITAETERAPSGSGIAFAAGLSLAVGEPTINPAPRAIIRDMLIAVATDHGASSPDVTVTISIPDGQRLAKKTMNARLGIIGGLSILGTTGIVIPYSCASWIHSIQRGIDVARPAGLERIAAATGVTSERAVQRLYGLPDHALIDMGDFAGATLKYLRRHPVARLIIAGGFAKLSKLAAGHLDLHSERSRVDNNAPAEMLGDLGAIAAIVDAARFAAGAGEILATAGDKREALARGVGTQAREVALATLNGRTAVEVAVVDRQGDFLARVGA